MLGPAQTKAGLGSGSHPRRWGGSQQAMLARGVRGVLLPVTTFHQLPSCFYFLTLYFHNRSKDAHMSLTEINSEQQGDFSIHILWSESSILIFTKS